MSNSEAFKSLARIFRANFACEEPGNVMHIIGFVDGFFQHYVSDNDLRIFERRIGVLLELVKEDPNAFVWLNKVAEKYKKPPSLEKYITYLTEIIFLVEIYKEKSLLRKIDISKNILLMNIAQDCARSSRESENYMLRVFLEDLYEYGIVKKSHILEGEFDSEKSDRILKESPIFNQKTSKAIITTLLKDVRLVRDSVANYYRDIWYLLSREGSVENLDVAEQEQKQKLDCLLVGKNASRDGMQYHYSINSDGNLILRYTSDYFSAWKFSHVNSSTVRQKKLEMHSEELKVVDSAILHEIENLDLSNCNNLVELSDLRNSNIKTLNLYNCNLLACLPGLPVCLQKLFISGNLCGSSFFAPDVALRKLAIYNSDALVGIVVNPSIQILIIKNCPRFVFSNPEIYTNLQKLVLSGGQHIVFEEIILLPNSLREVEISNYQNEFLSILLPDALKKCSFCDNGSLRMLPKLPETLEELDLANCRALIEVSVLPPILRSLDLENCHSLTSLPDLPDSLRFINLSGCLTLEYSHENTEKLDRLKEQGCQIIYPHHFYANMENDKEREEEFLENGESWQGSKRQKLEEGSNEGSTSFVQMVNSASAVVKINV